MGQTDPLRSLELHLVSSDKMDNIIRRALLCGFLTIFRRKNEEIPHSSSRFALFPTEKLHPIHHNLSSIPTKAAAS